MASWAGRFRRAAGPHHGPRPTRWRREDGRSRSWALLETLGRRSGAVNAGAVLAPARLLVWRQSNGDRGAQEGRGHCRWWTLVGRRVDLEPGMGPGCREAPDLAESDEWNRVGRSG